MAVLHRVVVNVVKMPTIVCLVANGVLPQTALPDASLSLPRTTRRDALSLSHAAGKTGFDQTPASREISVVFRQLPDTVQMVGQDHYRIKQEWMRLAHMPESAPQVSDVFDQQRPAVAIGKIDREEISRPGGAAANVGAHASWDAGIRYARPSLHEFHAATKTVEPYRRFEFRCLGSRRRTDRNRRRRQTRDWRNRCRLSACACRTAAAGHPWW